MWTFLTGTRGYEAMTTGKVLLNRLSYAIARSILKRPPSPSGWLASPWHWYRRPFPLRDHVLWSEPLQAWFCPEDESAMEAMFHLEKYEPAGWVTPRPGTVFLDIGAYVGWYSIQAARAVGPSGRVIALEPDESNRRQLVRNLSLNQIANCAVLPLAAWSRRGQVGWRPGEAPVWHRVDAAGGPGCVETITVDELVREMSLPRLDWIKMDIEGAELEALQGAEHTLRTFRPALFIEVHSTLQPLKGFLQQLDYSIERAAFDVPPDSHGWIRAVSKGSTDQ